MSCKNRSDSKGKTAPRRERRSPGRGAAGKGREGAFPPPGRDHSRRKRYSASGKGGGVLMKPGMCPSIAEAGS